MAGRSRGRCVHTRVATGRRGEASRGGRPHTRCAAARHRRPTALDSSLCLAFSREVFDSVAAEMPVSGSESPSILIPPSSILFNHFYRLQIMFVDRSKFATKRNRVFLRVYRIYLTFQSRETIRIVRETRACMQYVYRCITRIIEINRS